MRDVAKQYIEGGWSVVPLNPGEKRASTSWQKKTYSPDDFSPESNIAGKCGEPSGWRVDVDCDAPEAVLAARELLPRTELVHGRPSKQDSHYWYHCEGIKTTSFSDVKSAGNKTLIEIRSTGGYTALPPSTHPTGECFAWTLERAPMTITSDTLYESVRNVAIAALLARHYPGPGGRHAMAGHLTGFLLQGGLDEATIVRIVLTAAKIAGDPDVRDRENFVRSTCAKSTDKDSRLTGGPKLAEVLSEEVVTRLRAWLKLADVSALDDMNERHFWTRLGKDDVIGREDDDTGVVFQRVKALYSEYANRKVQTGVDKNGDPEFKPIFPTWLEWPQRRTFQGGVVFSPPPRLVRPDQYNLWTGFAIDPVAGNCDRFLEHLHEVICGGNDQHYRYLTKLCAYTLQHPGIAPGVATVLRGKPGTGKGTFIRVFQRIFGRRHFAHLDRVEDLVNFNALISGKIVVFADEAFWAGDKREIGALKRIITEPTIRVTRKGIDSHEEANCVHLYMATNEEWAVPAQLRERRFFALNVSDAHIQDLPYFNLVEDELKNGGAAAFLHEMLSIPVTAEEIRAVPLTAELRVQQNLSMPLELKWWHECLYEGLIGQLNSWGEWVPVSVIYEAYKFWVREHTSRFLDKIDFGRRLSKYLSAEKAKARRINGEVVRAVALRPLVEARKVFDTEAGTRSEWPDASSASSNSHIPF